MDQKRVAPICATGHELSDFEFAVVDESSGRGREESLKPRPLQIKESGMGNWRVAQPLSEFEF
jgi:hypothetical protein